MNNFRIKDVFKKSGLIALSDLNDPQYQDLFSKLEIEQQVFLDKESEFRSPSYRWPSDALHHWGRIWEYPYVYSHLKERFSALEPDSEAKVVDLGSGVTFFPYSVSKLGYHVQCLDIDAVCGPDIERAAMVVQHQPGKVDFRLIQDERLPLKDNEADALYCISVLEHIPDFKSTVETIAEVSRILKPNGLFILTIDLDFCGHMEIGARKYYDLRKCLFEHFKLLEPEITVHPLDVLHYRNGPFPYMVYSTWQKWKFYAKQRIKPFFEKKPFHSLPNLAIWCAVMAKKI